MDWLRVIWHLIPRIVAGVPGFVARLLYPPRRIQRLIEIDIRPRGDQLTFDCGDIPSVSLWLTISNGALLPIELDRLRVTVWCQGHRLGDLQYPDRMTVTAGAAKDILLRGLNGVQCQPLFVRERASFPCAIYIHAEFSTKVGRVVYETGQLEGIRPSVVNTSTPIALGSIAVS